MTTKEKDIIFETESGWWVWRDTKGNCYTVFMPKGTHSESDSIYPLTEDGLSLALVRCKYMDKRKEKRKVDKALPLTIMVASTKQMEQDHDQLHC